MAARQPGELAWRVRLLPHRARREPLGDRLRLLLDYDLPGAVPPVTGVPQPLQVLPA